jgi:DTW domain-containing protein
MSDYDLAGYHNPKRPRDPKAIRSQSALPNKLRKFCYDCWKAQELCLCKEVREIDHPLDIGIVFHPRERKNPINTGRLAYLSLKNVWHAVGVEMDEVSDFRKHVSQYKAGEIGLLYPSKDAMPLEEAPSNLKCLIVVDGTWNEAKKMIHRSPSLKKLPHFSFIPRRESNYRIRKEPAPHCVSTIEATVTCLQAHDISRGEEPQEYRELLDLFDKMVDNQLEFKEKHSHARHKNRQERQEEMWRKGALNWLYLSMASEHRKLILSLCGEEGYLQTLKRLKTPEAVVEWIQQSD